MSAIPTCRFCPYFSASHTARQPWDEILFQDHQFVVVPTKGALVAPWLLVIPKAHALSTAQLVASERTHLDELVSDLKGRIIGDGELFLFEHGAPRPGTTFGCGIDHAHVHLARLPFDLVEAIFGDSSTGTWTPSAAPWQMPNGGGYLAFGSARSWWTSTLSTPPRQFFRSIIARQLGVPEKYDYDENPHVDNATRSALALMPQSSAA